MGGCKRGCNSSRCSCFHSCMPCSARCNCIGCRNTHNSGTCTKCLTSEAAPTHPLASVVTGHGDTPHGDHLDTNPTDSGQSSEGGSDLEGEDIIHTLPCDDIIADFDYLDDTDLINHSLLTLYRPSLNCLQ